MRLRSRVIRERLAAAMQSGGELPTFSYEQSSYFLEKLAEVVYQEIENGEQVYIHGLGLIRGSLTEGWAGKDGPVPRMSFVLKPPRLKRKQIKAALLDRKSKGKKDNAARGGQRHIPRSRGVRRRLQGRDGPDAQQEESPTIEAPTRRTAGDPAIP